MVDGPRGPVTKCATKDDGEGRETLRQAVRQALELGLTPEQVRAIVEGEVSR